MRYSFSILLVIVSVVFMQDVAYGDYVVEDLYAYWSFDRSTVVGATIFLIWRSIHTTQYVLTDTDLTIKTTKLIGGSQRIRLNTITSMETTLLPVGFKLFGASFHGGYYTIPSIGRTFLAITNFEDGLLIQTTRGNYIITPKDPAYFKEGIEHNLNPTVD